jgi:hypothetical protein
MKLIFHHLLKDIRAQRWLLLLWALVLLLPLLINALVFQPDYQTGRYMETLRESPFLSFMNIIVWLLIIARLIQSDPVTGSTSFWLTRPIPTRVYLPSKLIFLAFLVLLPGVLSTFASELQFQATPEMVKDRLEFFVLMQLLVGLVIIWIATFTRNLVNFAGMLCGGLLGLLLLAILVAALASTHRVIRPMNPEDMKPGYMTAGYFFIVFILGLFASLVTQHWQRRGKIGLIVGITAIIAAAVVQVCLPVPPVMARAIASPTAMPHHIDFKPDWQNQVSRSHGPDVQTLADLTPVDMNDNAGLIIDSVDGNFTVPGESPDKLTIIEPFQRLLVRQRQQRMLKPLALLKQALPDYTIIRADNSPDPHFQTELFTLSLEQDDRLQGKTGALVMNITGQRVKLVQQARIPLNQPGYIVRIPGGFTRVAPLDGHNDGSLIVWKVAEEKEELYQQHEMIYVLVDPQNHTGTIVDTSGNSSSSNSIGGTYQLMNSEATLNLRGIEAPEQKVLYVFVVTPGDRFESTLTAPNFVMNPKQTAPTH